MELVLKQNSLKCLIRCINFNLGANRVIRNILLTMSKFRLPGTLKRRPRSWVLYSIRSPNNSFQMIYCLFMKFQHKQC